MRQQVRRGEEPARRGGPPGPEPQSGRAAISRAAITDDDLAAELPGLYRYARVRVNDPNRAEDLVQDVLVRALERRASYRGESSVGTWLHAIMHHRFVDLTRSRAAVPMAEGDLLELVDRAWRDDRYTVDADEVVARAQTREDLYDALVHLPAILRSAVVLHDMVGLTLAEIAQVHGATVEAAKKRLRRGRQALVSVLADDETRRAAMTGVPMRCWKARAMIGDYLDGGLTQPERAAIEAHLAGCPTCPGLVAGVVGVTRALGDLRDPDSAIEPALAARLRARITPGRPSPTEPIPR